MFKDYIVAGAFILAFFAIIFFSVIDGLSVKNWYSDKHDSKCEKLGFKSSDCKCYNRFMAKDGE
jgi:hypothetical protein